ncbi:MAG: branched-chain amino acid transaminase [Firmicutes bacterium]|nr:branched-chain amino acid transaminase [Bacillota bacterium]
MTKSSHAEGPSARQEIESGIVFFRGRLMDIRDATVSIATHALNYGTGCFEGIRAYWNAEDGELYILKGHAHYERFLRSAKILKIQVPYTVSELMDWTRAVLAANAFRQDVYIRPLAFKGAAAIKVALSGMRDEVGILATPMGDYVATDGLKATVSNWVRIADNMIPSRAKVTGAYINAALASDDAAMDGYDEAIMLSEDGQVAEASSSNLFMVRDGTLVTSPVTADILEGVTRQAVFQLARDLGWPLVERPIDRTELYVADEVFLAGTGVQIAGVTEIDHRTIGSGKMGPITAKLQEVYFQAVRGRDARYREWLTPVYGKEGHE